MVAAKLCNKNGISGGICSLLNDESAIHVCQFKNLLLSRGAEEEIVTFVNCTSHTCETNKLDKFFSYLRLIGDAGILESQFNNDSYSLEFLESYILYLIGQDIMETGTSEFVLDRHLSKISNKRLVDLMIYSDVLSNDISFVIQILSRFSNHDIDAMLSGRQEFRYKIMSIFRDMQLDSVFSMVLRTPEMYHYALLFFDLEGEPEEAIRVEQIWAGAARTADELRGIVKILSHPDLRMTGFPGKDRGRIASVIASLVLQTSDPSGVWKILEASSDLKDPDLRSIIRALITDETKRKELGFRVRKIDVQEILDWMDEVPEVSRQF